jgi:hypothetical protein
VTVGPPVVVVVRTVVVVVAVEAESCSALYSKPTKSVVPNPNHVFDE